HKPLEAMPTTPLLAYCRVSICTTMEFPHVPEGGQGQRFRLRLEPQDPVLPVGGSFLVNCTTDCPQPQLINLETSLSKEARDHGVGWAAFLLSNVTDDSQIHCSGYCNGSQIATSSGITVFRFPEVQLAPLPPWHPVGDNLTLRCLVTGGAPRARLSAVLLRGEEELSPRRPVVGEPAEVTATVLAGRGDHGANFSCRTELDLRPQGLGLFQNTSAPRQLRTFDLPATLPRVEAPLNLEVGTSRPVHCILDGLFPASEAQVQMALGDQMLDLIVTSHGDKLRAKAIATARTDQEGVREICLQRFLGPFLNLSDTNVTEWSTVNVTCTAGARVQVMLDGARTPPPGKPAQLQLLVNESDDGRDFFCNATLDVNGVVLHKNTTVQLRVLYGPRIDRAKCPQRLTWKDRTTHVLRCQARGNPAPVLRCSHERSGLVVPIGIPLCVNLTYNGTYHCKAASPRGTHTLLVQSCLSLLNNWDYSRDPPLLLCIALRTEPCSKEAQLWAVGRSREQQEVDLVEPTAAPGSFTLAYVNNCLHGTGA
uniref:Intercellular adhesion molecule 1 n=1 Tax=Castor canadensis TaxID=51338 RepID=A0A8C0WKK8_CASCN